MIVVDGVCGRRRWSMECGLLSVTVVDGLFDRLRDRVCQVMGRVCGRLRDGVCGK